MAIHFYLSTRVYGIACLAMPSFRTDSLHHLVELLPKPWHARVLQPKDDIDTTRIRHPFSVADAFRGICGQHRHEVFRRACEMKFQHMDLLH